MTDQLRQALDKVLASAKKALIRAPQTPEEDVLEVPVESPAPGPTGGQGGPGPA